MHPPPPPANALCCQRTFLSGEKTTHLAALGLGLGWTSQLANQPFLGERGSQAGHKVVPWETQPVTVGGFRRQGKQQQVHTGGALGPICPLEATGVQASRAAGVRVGSLPRAGGNQSFRLLGMEGSWARSLPSLEEVKRQAGREMQEEKAAIVAGQAGWFLKPFRRKPRGFRSSGTRRRRQGRLARGAVYLRSRRHQANRTSWLPPLLWPQGEHMPVLTPRFPLQRALQMLPVTGREPDTQRSPQTTPPRELLTPAGGGGGERTGLSRLSRSSPAAPACGPESPPPRLLVLRAPSLYFYSPFPLKQRHTWALLPVV